MPIPPITVNSCWWGKQIPFEVTVTHVTFRTVSFITVDKTFSDTIAAAIPAAPNLDKAALFQCRRQHLSSWPFHRLSGDRARHCATPRAPGVEAVHDLGAGAVVQSHGYHHAGVIFGGFAPQRLASLLCFGDDQFARGELV